MSIKITQQTEDLFLVNGKAIHKDSDGKWICKSELSNNEFETFTKHLQLKKKEIK